MTEKNKFFRRLPNILVAAGLGLVSWTVYAAFMPQNVEMRIGNQASLKKPGASEAILIPVELVNRTRKPVRLVGTNVC